MNTINQTKAGCYLLEIAAFNVKTEQSFNKRMLDGNALKIDGIYTHQDNSYTLNYKQEKIYTARRGGTDCYDYRNITLLINDKFYKGGFKDLQNNRVRYYINENGDQSIILASKISLPWNNDFSILCDNRHNNSNILTYFTLVTNTVMPNMDIVATKLVSY